MHKIEIRVSTGYGEKQLNYNVAVTHEMLEAWRPISEQISNDTVRHMQNTKRRMVAEALANQFAIAFLDAMAKEDR